MTSSGGLPLSALVAPDLGDVHADLLRQRLLRESPLLAQRGQVLRKVQRRGLLLHTSRIKSGFYCVLTRGDEPDPQLGTVSTTYTYNVLNHLTDLSA
jgi:hypothetical protein